MKILHVIPYLPTPPTFGGALRVYHLLRHNYLNHDLTVAGFSDNGELEDFTTRFPGLFEPENFHTRPMVRKFKRVIQLYSLFSKHSDWYIKTSSNRFQDQINSIVDKHHFDLVQFEFPPIAQYEIQSDAKRIMDAHNVEYDNFKRMYELEESPLRKYFYKREYEKFMEEEIDIVGEMDAVFTTSRRDLNIFKEHHPKTPMYVIPNGVDTEFFRPSDQTPEPNSLVFTGMMGYVPNYDGIIYFIKTILPMIRKQVPDIKLYVVGKNPPPAVRELASENIIVTGFVDDVRPYVHRSSVYVVPLRMGGGTRLKVLEALSMEKPVVTTSIGCEGIDIENNEHAVIADEDEKFAESVIYLLKNRKKAAQLAASGKQHVYDFYRWEAIGKAMDHAFIEIMNGKYPDVNHYNFSLKANQV